MNINFCYTIAFEIKEIINYKYYIFYINNYLIYDNPLNNIIKKKIVRSKFFSDIGIILYAQLRILNKHFIF